MYKIRAMLHSTAEEVFREVGFLVIIAKKQYTLPNATLFIAKVDSFYRNNISECSGH